jgi:hypothetical protein
MKASDRTILVGFLVAALAVGFYLLILAPKRDQASKLNDQIDSLHSSISQEQQVATFAEQARAEFPRYYGRLVVLGKAVPEQADTASMLVQLSSIASHSNADFRAIKLNAEANGTGTSSGSTAPATTAPSTTGSTSSSGSTGSTTPAPSATGSTTTPAPATGTTGSSTAPSTAASSTSTLVPATESNAASLPIGAVVGPGGLPTLPYGLTLRGGFFDMANFIGGIDGLVTSHETNQVSADGRLLTVDGFAFNINQPGANPTLDADFAVTSYVAPATEGLTAGASPSGPAPTSPTQSDAQPASAAVAQ